MLPNLSEVLVEHTDVLIAGSGAAGMRAAIAAHDGGARVTMLAKGPRRANHTRLSGGRYNVVTGLNPNDSTDAFFQDTIDSGVGINNYALTRILADEALDRAYDLEEYGLAWDRTDVTKYYLSMTGGGSFVRTIGSVDEGIGITEVMLHQMHKRGIRICDFHMLVDAVRDDNGRVAGGLVLDLAKGVWRYFECSALVIATGGTSQVYETNSGPTINTGDGIAIAMRAGAELVDIEFMQFIPISFVYPPSARGYTLTEPAHYGKRHFDPNAEAAHLLNNKGERFALKHDPVRKEGSTRDVLARAIMLEILEGRGTPEGGVLMVPDPDVFDAFLKERPIYVKRLLENYGEAQARLRAPIQVMPSALYTLGGVHGANRLGGSSMPDIQVFGRRAGMAAAEDAKAGGAAPGAGIERARARAAELTRPLGAASGVRPTEVKKRLQKLMWDHVGLVRNGSKLEETLRAFRETREHVLATVKVTNKARVLNREWMESIELENILDIGEAMAATSLQRQETRGAFYRTDFPALDPQWTANLWVKRDGRSLTVEKRAVQTGSGVDKEQPRPETAVTAGAA